MLQERKCFLNYWAFRAIISTLPVDYISCLRELLDPSIVSEGVREKGGFFICEGSIKCVSTLVFFSYHATCAFNACASVKREKKNLWTLEVPS